MDGTTTSLARETAPARTTLREDLAALTAFVRRPVLPDRVLGFAPRHLVRVLRFYMFDVAIMAGLLAVAALAMSQGFELPDNEINSLKLDGPTLALIILLAPLVEEIVFRSWLSGRPGHVLAALIGAIAIGTLVLLNTGQPGTNLAVPVILLIGLVLIAAALFALRRRGPMGWFAAAFPVLYFAATLAFALMHMLNYTEGALLMLLPLVLPQFIIGMILGYLRVTYGMWSNVLLHMLHNATFIGVVLLATQFGDK